MVSISETDVIKELILNQCSLVADECNQSASPLGVLCLHSTCVAINATLSNNCTYENTVYADYVNPDTNYGDIISR
jgi:hypothetical protein